jgi:hypothetical protein
VKRTWTAAAALVVAAALGIGAAACSTGTTTGATAYGLTQTEQQYHHWTSATVAKVAKYVETQVATGHAPGVTVDAAKFRANLESQWKSPAALVADKAERWVTKQTLGSAWAAAIVRPGPTLADYNTLVIGKTTKAEAVAAMHDGPGTPDLSNEPEAPRNPNYEILHWYSAPGSVPKDTWYVSLTFDLNGTLVYAEQTGLR